MGSSSPTSTASTSGFSASSDYRPVAFTDRELAVLSLVIKGKSSHDVAEALRVSKRTVDFHLGNIYHKLHVTNRVQAFREASRRGLITM